MMNIESINQIGLVVKNAKQKLENFQKLFNINAGTVQHLETEQLRFRPQYLGKEASFQLDVYLFQLGGIQFELIQPLTDTSNPYSDFLREHGEGIHHICAVLEDGKGFVNLMEQRNVEIHTRGLMDFGPPIGDAGYIFYDLRDELGLLLEMSVYEGPGAG